MRATAGYTGAPRPEPTPGAPNAPESAYRNGSRKITHSTAVTTVNAARDVSLPMNRISLERGLSGLRRAAVLAAAGLASSTATDSVSIAAAGAGSDSEGEGSVSITAAAWIAIGRAVAVANVVAGWISSFDAAAISESAGSVSSVVAFDAAASAPA